MLAPICLFTYNRLDETRQTVEALKRNFLASSSELFIFSDGPKNEANVVKVEEVRQYLRSVKGFKNITIKESFENKGLANSIIDGVSLIIEKYGKVIVLEDDLISTPNFLDFMNQGLKYYDGNKKVFSISGYTIDLPALRKYKRDFYSYPRVSSWGWATWYYQWRNIDWDIKTKGAYQYNYFEQIKFFRIGSDLPFMLKKQKKSKIDSWAIRWCFWQFKNRLITIYPSSSKIVNIGFGENSTNTKYKNYFKTKNDTGIKREFDFEIFIELDKRISHEFRNSYSIKQRLKNKLYLHWSNCKKILSII